MWILAAALALAGAYAGALVVVGRARRRASGLSAPLALAVVVCFESLLVHALSPLHAVARGSLLAGNAAFAVVALATLGCRSLAHGARRALHRARAAPLVTATLAGLFALACWSAALYLPNNWDSMTYHLARVAYWIQNESVGPYPTRIVRQVALPPGGEYLLLALQAIARSDALANFVQLGAWLILAGAAPPLARAFGAPRRLARWAGVVAVAAPMAMLQASSTQNDLLAAVLTVAVVTAVMPFLHGSRWRAGDLALLIVAVTAGLAVKPTSIVVAAPFLAWAAASVLRTLRPAAWRRALAAAPALIVAVGTLGPPAAAAASSPASQTLAPFVYGAWEAPLDRVVNSARGLARHLPLPRGVESWLAAEGSIGCPPGAGLCQDSINRPHEDLAGNPGQTLLFLAAIGLAVIRWRALSSRNRGALLALVASWVLFHALFRHNLWLARIQLPLFGLVGLALVALPSAWTRSRLARFGTPAIALVLAAIGARAAVLDELRPVSFDRALLSQAHTPVAYYFARGEELHRRHLEALNILAASGCRHLGLVIGVDSFDYPLAWRAMQMGVEVRHLVGPGLDGWAPCAAYVEDPVPPPGGAAHWVPSVVPSMWFSESFVDAQR
jgi:hypothetical protein